MKNKEIELKFGFVDDCDDANLVKVLSSIGPVKQTGVHELKNTYFDTADRKLFSVGAGVRIRKSSDICEQTLKVKGETIGGLHRRSEFNIKLGYEVEVPSLKKFPLDAFPDGFDFDGIQKELLPICKINFTRKTYILEALDSTFEVAFDKGSIECQSNDAKQDIRELEIELIESTVPDTDILPMFIKLIDYLVKSPLKLTIEPFSKMHRASILEHRSKVLLDIEPMYPENDIVSRVTSLLSNTETLIGYFKSFNDPCVLLHLSSSFEALDFALEALDEKEIPAFEKGQKELLDYTEDLDWLIHSVKKHAKCLKKLSHKYYKAYANENEQKCQSYIAKLLKSEIENRLFSVPLKLRWLLSLLSN